MTRSKTLEVLFKNNDDSGDDDDNNDDNKIDDDDNSVQTFPAWLPETTYLESGEKRTVQASTGPFSIVATF